MKLKTRADYQIEYFKELPSSFLYAKAKRSLKKDLIIVTDSQSSGIGTKGRVFSSGKGGAYLTALNFFEGFPAKEAFKIMANCALSVCKTLALYEVKPLIKWPNDIFVQDKKICGILIENIFSGNMINSSLVGIGVNIANPLPKELENIAITLSQALNRQFTQAEVEEFREKLIDNLLEEKPNLMNEYRSYIGYMGKDVLLLIGDECVPATLLSVCEDGKLQVRTAEGEQILSSAEVTVRI